MPLNFNQTLIQSAFRDVLDPNLPYALFDFPNHPNVGDSVIWQGEITALSLFFKRQPQITTQRLKPWVSLPKLAPDVQILIHGGGNVGDLWEVAQIFRERLISEYPLNLIVQLPQSVLFQNPGNAQRFKDVLAGHENFVLMVRDNQSFQRAIGLHSGRILLVPDMALALNRIQRPNSPKFEILALLRSDKEKSRKDNPEMLDQVEVVDWLSEPLGLDWAFLEALTRIPGSSDAFPNLLHPWRTRVSDAISARRTRRGCELLSNGKVIITDRLHAHILCALMGIPHVILDNSYGKLSSFTDTWQTCPQQICMTANNLEEAYQIASKSL